MRLEPAERSAAPASRAVITDAPGLAEVEGEWRELWQRCPDATPFQSPDWLLPWWQNLGEGTLHVVTSRNAEGLLEGVAPFVIDDGADQAPPVLRLLGTGVSDYGDVLVEPAREAEFIARIVTGLDGEWECGCADLQQLRSKSPLLSLARTSGNLEAEIDPHEPCPVVALDGGRSKWLPSRWRRKIDYERRRLANMTRLKFERAESHNIDELFDAFLRLHRARWAAAGSGMLAVERVRAFHHEVVDRMLASGVLRLYALRAGGAIVASYYGFLAGWRAYYYLGGFDPEWGRFGVGSQMIDHAMADAATEGATTFDFLRGCEPYKYRWGARDEPTFRLRIRRNMT
jgi:CelD/BcsL family acetyltransferase involved in cellulose biosynthesis